MVERERSWRKLQAEHGPSFLQWLEAERVLWKRFSGLADTWDAFLEDFLADVPACHAFMEAMPKVVFKCNQDIYGELPVVMAYAHVYLLERYRRFWAVLAELVRANSLPLGDRGVQVLDVGTGPAPVLYAVSDFYDAIVAFGAEQGLHEFTRAAAELHLIESSRAMRHVIHLVSEYDERPAGPFDARYGDFDSFDPDAARDAEWRTLIRQLVDLDDMSEDQARRWAAENPDQIHATHRYLLCTFSNFLTEVDRVRQQRVRIAMAFRSVRPGGVAVIVGATGDPYPDIYAEIADLAVASRLTAVDLVPQIRCVYNERRAGGSHQELVEPDVGEAESSWRRSS